VVKRYRDAYLVSRVIVGLGILFKVAGCGVAGLIVVYGLSLTNQQNFVMTLLAAAAFGAFLGGLLWAAGVLVEAQGQILKAALDSAVNTSPFLRNEQRAEAMSL